MIYCCFISTLWFTHMFDMILNRMVCTWLCLLEEFSS